MAAFGLAAKKLFNRAALFVGAHGAGLSLMVFMPSGSVVIELRPSGMRNNRCFRRLAQSCDLQFTVMTTRGAKYSRLSADVTRLTKRLESAKKYLQDSKKISL